MDVAWFEDKSLEFLDEGRVRLGTRELEVGEAVADAILRAVIPGALMVAVFEETKGGIFLVGKQGVLGVFRPVLEDSNVGDFEPGVFERLIAADEDVLGERILAAGEPDYESIAEALPRLVDYTFVGDPRVDERAILNSDGSIEGLLEPLADMAPEELAARGRWGLLDASVPVPMLRIEEDGGFREQITLAVVDKQGRLVPLVRRRTVTSEGEQREYLVPGQGKADPAEFYEALLTSWLLGFDFLMSAAAVEVGDQLLSARAFSSLMLADLTARGCRPRYGIGVYDQERHHGFPPATLYLVHCLLDWGHFERARDILDCYLNAFINEDGTFAYYGPALAEYGQMLALAVRFHELTDDMRWLVRRLSVLRCIWQRLLQLRRDALEDTDAPEGARGLVPGLPEADYHGDQEQWREYYFSGDAWAIRGLREVVRALHGKGLDNEAAALEDELAAWADDLRRAVNGAKVPGDSGVFVPPGPTQRTPYEHMTQERHASYVNYRYWAEMISAGVLDKQTMRQVLDYRRSHGGELLGMTRFEDRLDDWPVLNYARALLELGEVNRYLLLMYAHLAHHQAAGWLASYEQVSIRPDERGLRHQVAGQVTPCQVVVPQMLRWALLYEMRDEELLLVMPCVPWRWVEDNALLAADVPTRWGPMTVDLGADGTGVEIALSFPEQFSAQVRVRVPTPETAALTAVKVDGRRHKAFDARARTIDLTDPADEIVIEATFSP